MLPPRAIIAASLLALLPAPAHCGKISAEHIVFAAWNVRNYLLTPSRDGTSPAPPKPAESIVAVVTTLRTISPDILGLCEIGTRKDLADLQRRLATAGLRLPHSTWVDGPDKQRHLALLSRFPLVEVRHETRRSFPLGGVIRRVQRGILDCTVQVGPGFALRILGVHLKSPRVVPDFDQAEFRRAESLILRRHVEDILESAPQTRLLVFGDFNDSKNSPVVTGVLGRAGAGTSLTALPLADRQGDQWTYRWEEGEEYTRVDYVMVSGNLRPLVRRSGTRLHRSKDWFKASDHRPLIVNLNLPDAETP